MSRLLCINKSIHGPSPFKANYRYGWQSNKITKGGGGEKKGRKEKLRKEKGGV
jgi:hypothetical protein